MLRCFSRIYFIILWIFDVDFTVQGISADNECRVFDLSKSYPPFPDELFFRIRINGLATAGFWLKRLESPKLFVQRKGELRNYKSQSQQLYKSIKPSASFTVTKRDGPSGQVYRTLSGFMETLDGRYYQISDAGLQTNSTQNPTAGVTHHVNERQYPQKRRRKRSVNETLTAERYDVEITVVVDHSLYKWFLDAASGNDFQNQALDSIQKYYANVISGANLRYRHLGDSGLDIHLWLKAYVVIETARDAFFTESEWVRDGAAPGSPRVNSLKALVTLRLWDINKNHSLLSSCDHVMAFTKYYLYKISEERSDVKEHGVGVAFVERICTSRSYSLIEEKGGFKSEGVAAHELGHSLGVLYHDGEEDSVAENCSAGSQFVMAPVNRVVDSWNANNPYMFSSCSAKQMQKFLANTEASACLRDGGSHTSQWPSYTSTEPGQYVNIHEQCRQRVGAGSLLCGLMRDDICQELWCTLPAPDRGCVTTGGAARGTTCGDKKWCARGFCSQDDAAPHANEYCLHGDYPSALETRSVTCKRYVGQHPGRCYSPTISERCCHTCYMYQQHERPDCSYGDSKKWCASIPLHRCLDHQIKWHCCNRCIATPFRCHDNSMFDHHGYNCPSLIATFGQRQCYHGHILRNCCDTCRRYRNHHNPDCMFGDKIEFMYRNSRYPQGYNCHDVMNNLDLCASYYVRQDCCETCMLF